MRPSEPFFHVSSPGLCSFIPSPFSFFYIRQAWVPLSSSMGLALVSRSLSSFLPPGQGTSVTREDSQIMSFLVAKVGFEESLLLSVVLSFAEIYVLWAFFHIKRDIFSALFLQNRYQASSLGTGRSVCEHAYLHLIAGVSAPTCRELLTLFPPTMPFEARQELCVFCHSFF